LIPAARHGEQGETQVSGPFANIRATAILVVVLLEGTLRRPLLPYSLLLAAVCTIPASAEGVTEPVRSALKQCFEASPSKIPPASDPKTVPPALIEGKAVNIVPVPGTNARAFAYEGIHPRVQTCGIALYGPVEPSLQRDIRQMIEDYALQRASDGRPAWKPYSPDRYNIADIPAATKDYWASPLAPSMYGVLMLTQSPSPNAPTLEVQYHAVLVQ
jgi:hypothetical protein